MDNEILAAALNFMRRVAPFVGSSFQKISNETAVAVDLDRKLSGFLLAVGGFGRIQAGGDAMATDLSTLHDDATETAPVAFFLPAEKGSDYEESFWRLCLANPELRFEMNDDGRVVIMTPTGWDSGRQNGRIKQQLANWCDQDGSGEIGDSNSLYRIFKHSRRAPDASWILKSRLETVAIAARKKILPIAPDFVIELVSPSDTLPKLRQKMQEYMEAGVRLGWLIDPETRLVEIYRPGKEVERIENAESVSGDPELPGFLLDLGKVW